MRAEGHTVAEIAETLKVNTNTVYKWIHGEEKRQLRSINTEMTEAQRIALKILYGARKDAPKIIEKLRKLSGLDDDTKPGSLPAIALYWRVWRELEKETKDAMPDRPTVPTFHLDVNLRRDPKVVDVEPVGKPIAMLEEAPVTSVPVVPVVEFENIPAP